VLCTLSALQGAGSEAGLKPFELFSFVCLFVSVVFCYVCYNEYFTQTAVPIALQSAGSTALLLDRRCSGSLECEAVLLGECFPTF
jgi:hypothetical protein